MAYVLLVLHRTPLYGVETDLFGDSIPAARAILSGHPTATQYEFKGPGYPLLLALSTLATFGDAWLAARLLNLLAAVVGAGFAFLLVRRTVGTAAAWFVLAALCASPLYVRTTLEAGTDLPTFALCMAATYFALTARAPRAAAAAGLLAGLAILCRYNAAFLLPAGVLALALRRERSAPLWMMLSAFVLGLALPVAPWLVLNQSLSGSAFSNRNYANLAFELYGGGMRWDRFWEDVAPRFHSFADVLRYDPGRALAHWFGNLGTRWLTDLRQLVPVWIGIAAVLGTALNLRRAPKAAGLLLHGAFCYATLALVFYTPRFFLYLVPFYLIGAALAFFPRASWAARLGRWPVLAAILAVLASAILAARETAALLRDQPWEVTAAGEVLREVARPGDRLLARKPQVAYFANMAYEPIPQVETLRQLLIAARQAGANYLNVSGIEGSLRPQFRLLLESQVHLPGFTPLARRADDPDHYFALYRIEPAGPADAAFDDSMRAALRGMSARNPDNAQVQAYVGALLMNEGEPVASVAALDRAVALAPQLVQPRAFRAVALVEVGRLDEAAQDCQQVIASLARPPAEFYVLLGYIRARQDRLVDAQAAFESAVRLEPANVAAQLVLGLTMLARGQLEPGQAAIDQAIRLAPGLVPIRGAALERARKGDSAALERWIETTRRTLGRMEPIESVVDSVRSGGG